MRNHTSPYKLITVVNLIVTILIMFCLCFLNGCKGNSGKSVKKIDTSERKTGTVLSNETKINYFIEGKGYPCIVVTEGELISKAMSKELKDHFKFIFINARMNIMDPGEIDKISFNLLTEDVDQVRKSLNLEKVGVFGHSISGLIALEYARNYPQHTTFVIINGTPPYSDDRLAPICSTYWETTASKERKGAFLKNWLNISRDSLNILETSESGKLAYILDGPQCFFDYNFKATSLLENSYWNMRVWNQVFKKLMIDYDLEKGNSIDVPVFLALGKYDYFVPYISWNNQKNKIPKLTLNLFKKSGHYSFFEEEELFRKKVIDWFEDLKDKI